MLTHARNFVFTSFGLDPPPESKVIQTPLCDEITPLRRKDIPRLWGSDVTQGYEQYVVTPRHPQAALFLLGCTRLGTGEVLCFLMDARGSAKRMSLQMQPEAWAGTLLVCDVWGDNISILDAVLVNGHPIQANALHLRLAIAGLLFEHCSVSQNPWREIEDDEHQKKWNICVAPIHYHVEVSEKMSTGRLLFRPVTSAVPMFFSDQMFEWRERYDVRSLVRRREDGRTVDLYAMSGEEPLRWTTCVIQSSLRFLESNRVYRCESSEKNQWVLVDLLPHHVIANSISYAEGVIEAIQESISLSELTISEKPRSFP